MSTGTARAYRSNFTGRFMPSGSRKSPESKPFHGCRNTYLRKAHCIKDRVLLDPCCGSGVFVVSCYEHLYNKALRILSDNEEERTLHDGFFYIQNDQLYLTIAARQAIISNCLYAIDLDASAVEVTKMSLALKTVDGNNALAWQGIGAFGDRILQNISENIKNGNTLVEPNNAFTVEELTELKPIDTSRMFSCVFENFEGFHYIVGNPPYVETKHFKAATPTMHSYLSEHYSSFSGKADLAVLFIEKCLHLLNENGVLGFIIQRRWFRTEYGKGIRRIINNNKHLSKLIDFKSTDIFKGRIVYASIMILSNQPRDEFSYLYLPLSTSQIITEFENSDEQGHFNSDTPILIPVPSNESTWNFNYYEITALANILRERLGSLSDYPNLMIKDGIQALWKKVYHLKNVRFDGNTANSKIIILFEITTDEENNRIIKLYDLPLSAGTGNLLDESDSTEYITYNPKADFALKISGNSMEPTIKNESVVLVQKCETIEDSEIGAFYLNGEAFCKRLQHINATTYLVSDNDTYSPIQIKADDELKLFGKVIEVVNNV